MHEIKFTDPYGDNAPNNDIEFLLIGTDGLWEGGDFHDTNGYLIKSGQSVMTYVAQRMMGQLNQGNVTLDYAAEKSMK